MKGKIISIRVDQIAHINTENLDTSIHCLDSNKYTNNSSLIELYYCLDHATFLGQIDDTFCKLKELMKYSEIEITNQKAKLIIYRVSAFVRIRHVNLKNG